MRYFAPIVEGHGEVEALPALIHRIALAADFQGVLRVNPPIRIKSASFINDEAYFQKQVTLVTAKAAQEAGTVLILLDCEDDCPGTLGPSLLQRAKAVRENVDIFVALAYREFETWFLASAESLRGVRGLPGDLTPPPNAVLIRDAKGWLGSRMNIAYDPVSHQLEFVRKFNLEGARSNQSFDRFYLAIHRLLHA